MVTDDTVRAVETFLRAHLTEHFPPPPPGTDTAVDFATVFDRVEALDDPPRIRVVFGMGMPFTIGDRRVPERINGCIEALLAAHPELRGLRIDVTVSTIEA